MPSTVSKLALACALGIAAVSGPANAADEKARSAPNILLIIADDVGLDVTTGMYPMLLRDLVEKYGPRGRNHPEHAKIEGKPASTPVLNELAQKGMVFTNAWAHPFCSPTRASLLTGLTATKTNVLTYADALSQNHASFVRSLKERGNYATAVFGKWHMAGLPGRPVDYPGMKPKEAGFDLFKGGLHAAPRTYWNYDYLIQDARTSASEWRAEPAPEKALPGIAPTPYLGVVEAANAVEWIKAQEASDPDRPWFGWLAFHLAHATAQTRPSQMMVPNADTLDDATRREMEACGGSFGSANVGSCTGEQLMRAMTNSMDTLIGKVLDAVDEVDPNTYVILVSDNGTPMYGRPGLNFIDNMYITRAGRGKGTPHEGGVRVPMVIRGPGIAAGSSSDEFVQVYDLFATILNLAGLEAPRNVPNRQGDGTVPLDSTSLTPILFGDARAVRDPNAGYVLTETRDLMRNGAEEVAARNARYKVLCKGGTDNCEFYDLVADPLEEYPLAKPSSCTAGAWTTADPQWHYCHLTRIVDEESFL